jgi:hypothetical protein
MKRLGYAGRFVVQPPRVQRGEVGRKALDLELVEPLRAGHVLQHVLAQVANLDAVVEERSRRIRQEHLAAVGRCHHACGLMDVEPNVGPVDRPRFARVQADAYPDLVPVRPNVGRESTLRLLGSRRGLGGRLEGGEEGVAITLEHTAPMALERLAEKLPVPRELLGIPVSQPAKETRGALRCR